MTKYLLIILSLFFVFLSFSPSLYEIYQAKNLPDRRAFELVHNYVFDYNFYLSRIREGGEGKWLVVEKYYNQPHQGSLIQVSYLLLGKLGGIGGLGASAIYHSARFLMGLILLLVIGKLVMGLFSGWWQLVAYIVVVTASSWPVLVKLSDGFYRLSSHWGGWSVIDPLLRITFLPHVLAGQVFLILFVKTFAGKPSRLSNSLMWGMVGLLAGIIFPPVLITVYVILTIVTLLEIFLGKSLQDLKTFIIPRVVFILISLPALVYLQVMFKVEPWKALAVFDIEHRSILPYVEYALALGPVLPLGLAGLVLVLIKKDKKFFPLVSWVLALCLLFIIFEHVPQQSPTRFTQMLFNVPLAILATYLFFWLWQVARRIRVLIVITVITVILLGLALMGSMVAWKTDEVKGKMAGTWLYPVGVQLVYPLKDFMAGIDYLRLNTKTSDVVLAYEAAGNYIPAYGGNFVYLGHANTPDEDVKLRIAARFFKGEMKQEEAKAFLQKERISYIFFGPQEREVGGMVNLNKAYAFLEVVFRNEQILIYKLKI